MPFLLLSSLLLLLLLLLLLVYLVIPFLRILFRQCFSPLRLLPGPPSPSFFFGNLAEIHDQENNNLIHNWEKQFGSTFVYRGFIGGCRLMTTDPVAIAHILGNAYDYPKPDFVRDSLASMVAGRDGILIVEGEHHKRQRKILTPAFSSTHVKSLAPIFRQSATQLRDIWLAQADAHTRDPSTEQSTSTRVDALMWLSRATLDIIGLAGFGYNFNSLQSATSSTPAENELANAFSIIFSTARKFRIITVLQVWFPFLRGFRRNNAAMTQARNTMRRIGMQLIEEKRRAMAADIPIGTEKPLDGIERNETKGRDLLSILIRSNLSTTPSQQMSISEVLCQISTFIAAGHETTSSALTWCLYALARDRDRQNKLRRELRALTEVGKRDRGRPGGGGVGIGTGHQGERDQAQVPAEQGEVRREGNWDEIKEEAEEVAHEALFERICGCEYLDWVVREALRVHAPITSTMRMCMRERDEIPVGKEGYVDKHGRRKRSIPVKRWDIVSVPIQAINKSTELWGEDAREFRPERWAKPPASVRAIPGLFANTLTFLNGNPINGNRACIGFKFALFEIKMFLYVLLKEIEFSMDLEMVVEKRVNVVTRPFIKSEPHLGNQMPLNIKRALP